MNTLTSQKNAIRLLCCAAVLLPALAHADSSLKATTTLASDYIADGVSASDSKPALQLGINYQHDSGFYIGAWTSNIDSDDQGTPNLELDYSGGFKSSITDSLSYDLGITRYTYYHVSNHDEFDYTEWYAGLTLLENTTAYYYYSNNDDVWNGIQRRYILEHTQPLPEDFSLILTAEHLTNEKSEENDYNTYRIGAGKKLFDMDISISYWANTIHHGDDTTDNRFVLAISKEFDLMDAFNHH